MRLRAVLALGAVAAASAVLAQASPAARLEGTVVDGSFLSKALAARVPYEVYLPPGYATSGLRYPVITFLHGLPADDTAYRGADRVGAELERSGRRAIVVFAQGSRASDPDPEYIDWGPGRDWETMVSGELRRFVDSHYRTIPNRTGRALVGVSAGGYGAVMIGIHHLDLYSVIESWSGYFHPTDQDGVRRLILASPAADLNADAHAFVGRLRAEFQAKPTFFGFYVGAGDPFFADENDQFDDELSAAHVPHLFEIYQGGHDPSLWERFAPAWLGLAVDHLAAASR